MRYGEYIIIHSPKPIPIRQFDYDFYHEDYDGAPNETGGPPADHRAGSAPSIEDAKRQIDEIVECDAAGNLFSRADLIGEIEDTLEETNDKMLAMYYRSILGMEAVPNGNGFFRVKAP